MKNKSEPPIILVANNPFGNHLLTSQLVDLYKELDLDTEIILLANGVLSESDSTLTPFMRVISYKTSWGPVGSYLKLVFKFISLRLKYPKATYHLRGFFVALFFSLSRLFWLRGARYIYDPRGALFVEWREAGRSLILSRFFAYVEGRLIKNSFRTIVTTRKFGRLYKRLFGHSSKYLTIYNSTSFAFFDRDQAIPLKGPVRLVYLGTFNHWHDIDEICRVFASAVHQIGSDRAEIFIYTSARFHDVVRSKFSMIDCALLHVGFVNYHDIPEALADKHIGVSVVRPTLSTGIASPIKISDYVANGLLPLLNSGIGDFDAHYCAENSAILYRFGQEVDMAGLDKARTAPNKMVYDQVSREQSRAKLAPIVERLRDG